MILHLDDLYKKYTSADFQSFHFESQDYIHFQVEFYKFENKDYVKIKIFDVFGYDNIYPLKLYNKYNWNQIITFEEKPTILLENIKFDHIDVLGVNIIIKNCVIYDEVVLHSELSDD